MLFETVVSDISPWIPICWGVLVGLVFSMVGAAGGILASVGMISVMGITQVNMVKPMAQILTIVTPLVAVPSYFKQGRLVYSIALLLGAGGAAGAVLGSTFSAAHLSGLSTFKPVFGVLTLIISVQIIAGLVRRNKANPGAQAARAFEDRARSGQEQRSIGVRHTQWSLRRIHFTFGGQPFSFSPWLPFGAGFGVALISSAMGVGGGFLLVPFLASVMGLPMFIVAATAATAIVFTSAISVANYLRLGVELDMTLLVYLMVGVIVGALLGPWLSRFMRDRWLKGALAGVLLFIGLVYLAR